MGRERHPSFLGRQEIEMDGFDRFHKACRYRKLELRWFKTKKVRKEMDQILAEILTYDLEQLRREHD